MKNKNIPILFGVAVILVLAYVVWPTKSSSYTVADEAFKPVKPTTETLTMMHPLGISMDLFDKLQVADVDLNNDGTPEKVFRVHERSFCGNSGCMHPIFIKEKDGWQLLTILFGYKMEIFPAPKDEHHFANIRMEEQFFMYRDGKYIYAPILHKN